jgi:hypothetical protein
MPRPVLYTNRAVAANLKNKTKHCTFVLPANNLSGNIRHQHVTVARTDGYPIDVQSARGVQDKYGAWFLVVRTKEVPQRRRGESEEITITVTNPDTNESSLATDPPLEVVYNDEENFRDKVKPARIKHRPAIKPVSTAGKPNKG